jgi:uncharacterized protein YegL
VNINHVVLVLDASLSMTRHRSELIRVADSQIKYLAKRSQELDQETRVTVYSFSDPNKIECLVYDKDVLRLPSIAQMYHVGGMTALVDATIRSMDELAETPQRYGDHSFLIFVLTDGQENVSRTHPRALTDRMRRLQDNWTVAVLVPDQVSKREAQMFGFPKDNIAVWDPEGATGVEEAGETIRRATDNFMVARTQGVRGSRSIFGTGADVVNDATVKTNLTPLNGSEYDTIRVHVDGMEIRDFVQTRGLDYKIGSCFYQLVRTEKKASEKVQPQKQILVREKSTNKVYAGSAARKILGLPDTHEVRVKPDHNNDYDIFVQSTSVNRHVVLGTDLIVIR